MTKTIDVKVTEHRRLRSRSHKQFKFGLKIILLLLFCLLMSLLILPKISFFLLALLIVFSITTAVEHRNWKKHESALKKTAKHI
jgi:accessory gene regulator protein AgrB